MTSKYTGAVDITLCGKPCSIKFDWETISEIITEFGEDAFKGIFQASPKKIAFILAAAAHDPEITAEKILADSPPIMPMLKAIDTGIAYAYFGADKAPEEDDGKKKPKTEKTV